MSAVAQRIAAVMSTRTVHTYTLPKGVRNGGPTKIGLQQLNAEQELLASKIGNYHYTKTQYEAAKMSIVEFDGKPADHEGIETFWDNADPKLRSLLIQTYSKMSSPTAEDADSFFKSEEIRVG